MFAKIGVLSAAFVVGAIAVDCDTAYKGFLEEFPDKSYSADKKAAFCKNLQEVQEHNQQNSGWSMGINELSDWTAEEVSVLFGAIDDSNHTSTLPIFEPKTMDLASSVDWRSRMPAVKNQGHCGSCWAFATIDIIDFQSGGSHSEQQLLDCSGGSCDGSSATSALKYLTSHGSETESQYPYHLPQGSCHYKSGGPKVSNIRHMSGADQIQRAVQEQVVSVSIDISHTGPFHKYRAGVYDSDCGTGGGHAIGLVGYGDDYWIIRNSWGSSWGQHGYIYFKKGKNLCRVESRAPVTATLVKSRVEEVIV